MNDVNRRAALCISCGAVRRSCSGAAVGLRSFPAGSASCRLHPRRRFPSINWS